MTPFVSQYGEPHPRASTWHWQEIEGGQATGNGGTVRGSTEMEALDRLREEYPGIGAIKWVKRVAAPPEN
jgi:hypothetical protein